MTHASTRHGGRAAFPAWTLALLPLALTVFFARQAPAVLSGSVRRLSFDWIPELGLGFSLYLDGLSLLFALLISGIGVLVTLYASGYLAGHPQAPRFYLFLFLFMASMLGLVLADNLILLFVCWELTSLSSYFLIGFYHEDEKSRASALQALLVTGLGGLAMLAGFLLLGAVSGSPDLSTLAASGESVRAHALYGPILLLILAGAFTKSAQFPFHFWLPNAMTAPAPVSAYLHSSTMVKAGVYLLARLSPVLGETFAWTLIVTTAGAATCLVGAWLSLREKDMKRNLAYLTVSALGMMVMLLGIGSEAAEQAAMAFLLAHAFYKGALFMTAGSVDHAVRARDPEALSGLRHGMPLTAAASVLAALSMAALPPFFGFVGKEMVLDSALHSPWPAPASAVIVCSGIIYVAVAWLVGVKPFVGRPASPQAHESPWSMNAAALALAGLGLGLGLFPDLLGRPLVARAAEAVIGHPSPLKLSLWHGPNLALSLSALTFLAGTGLYAARKHFRSPLATVGFLSRWGPERAYQGVLAALTRLAVVLTRSIQDGYLRHYFRVVIVTVVALAGWALLRTGLAWPAGAQPAHFFEVGLSALIIAATVALVFVRQRFSVIALMGAVAIGVMLIFVHFGAPDLAVTQFAAETLTVILLALVLYRFPASDTKFSRPGSRLVDGVIAGAFGLLMFAFAYLTMSQPARLSETSRFFAEHSVSLGHGRNIVNVILVDFRAIDTLGEITVLAVAGIGVYALIRLGPSARKGRSK